MSIEAGADHSTRFRTRLARVAARKLRLLTREDSRRRCRRLGGRGQLDPEDGPCGMRLPALHM